MVATRLCLQLGLSFWESVLIYLCYLLRLKKARRGICNFCAKNFTVLSYVTEKPGIPGSAL